LVDENKFEEEENKCTMYTVMYTVHCIFQCYVHCIVN